MTDLKSRNRMIADSYRAGVKMRQLAAKYQLTYRSLYNVLKQMRVKLRGWQDKVA